VIPHSSPGWSLRTEHPTGPEYADYLAKAVEVLELTVRVGADVVRIESLRGRHGLILSDGTILNARCVVWAAGEFQAAIARLKAALWARQKHHGVAVVPSNDFSVYDRVLDTCRMVGAIPERFGHLGGPSPLTT